MEHTSQPPAGIFGAGQSFFVGCNYWASHAGTAMWRDWREEVVAADLQLLEENGVEVMRVFPLWPDFQPLEAHTHWAQTGRELRIDGKPLPDTPAGRAGVDERMVARFRRLAELAAEHHQQLIVGLVTGWMSGRMHVPPAFAGINVLTDPEAILWQIRMVRYLVAALKDCPAIVAWDLGNECNCMAPVSSPYAAWNWCNAIASAIRLEDATRPVVSGMHSLACFASGNHWTIAGQAETTDVLTTHPYPLFTPGCALDPIHTMRNAFHATAETRLYGDVGNVSAFVEEAGTLGPAQSSDQVAGRYMNNLLWNSFAHDCRGMLWWCAFDQDQLEHTPYDWVGVERELGLVRTNREPKPALKAMGEFGRLLDRIGLRQLPAFRRDAVMILTQGQDCWLAAYSGFLMAKQAGFDLEFQTADQPLKPASLYLMPSINGLEVIPRHRYLELLAQVRAGATLLVTSDCATLQPYNQEFGFDIEYTADTVAPLTVKADGYEFRCPAARLQKLVARKAEVLAVDAEGSPIFTRNAYGDGALLYLAAPIELAAATTPRAFYPEAPAFYEVYRVAAATAGITRCATRSNPSLTLTEHPVSENERLVIAVNNTPEELSDWITPAPGWSLQAMVWGNEPVDGRFTVPGNSGVILQLKR